MSGAYLVTAISVTGLIGPSGFNGNDNLLYPTSNPVLDQLGLGFVDQNVSGVYRVDLYASGSQYFAFITDNTNFSSVVPVTFSVVSTTATPEPSSLALLGTGVLGVVGVARRRFAFTR